MSDTLTPERITQLRGLGAYQGGLLKTELDALLDAAEELHAIENRAENPTCKRCIKVRVHSLEDDRDRLASENATLRAELATWKHRAGNKWSQHDIDQAKKIGKLTNDLFAAYAEVARLTDCNPGTVPVS